MTDITSVVEKLKTRFGNKLELSENGQAIYVDKKSVLELLKTLKEEFKYIRLMDVTSADYEDRYEVVYQLTNEQVELLAVKVKLDKNDCRMPSIINIWRAADAQEREIYDLMGIVFEGHGNLKRILNPDDFTGHPLRKSFVLDKASRF